MAKSTIAETVADAVVQAEIASVKAARRVVGAVQRKVAGVRKGVSKQTTVKKPPRSSRNERRERCPRQGGLFAGRPRRRASVLGVSSRSAETSVAQPVEVKIDCCVLPGIHGRYNACGRAFGT